MLPSVLPSKPSVRDVSSTKEDIENAAKLAKVTSPEETALFICAYADCNRLYPKRDRLMLHRKRDHQTEDEGEIITWNEEAQGAQ
ncbi:hypothetical protein BD626DRAFT_486299 [Schizophyllum amplum]|uniref:C2H2-type domain-containing protein n=1 Tax=Schizophyllum amplum TaxID=97359 RepID=A0A550CMF7_9AGAR|nr:hypothetical protein BD626DRAFT_486299 [Auriculariopsis ampla]